MTRAPNETTVAIMNQVDDMADVLRRLRAALLAVEDLGPVRGSRLLCRLVDLTHSLEVAAEEAHIDL